MTTAPPPLLLDEGLPRQSAAELRDLGWAAHHVTEVGLGGEPDRAILEWARERGYAVVTLDSDFPRMLATTFAASPSVLLVRLQGLSRVQTTELLAACLPAIAEALAEGAIIVHTGGELRVRRLPTGRQGPTKPST